MTRELDTTELAKELGLERSKFVKNRGVYEKKLIANGFPFIKQGTQRNIVYYFSTEETVSIGNLRKKIEKSFSVDTQSLNKAMDKYLRFIYAQKEKFTIMTDLEVAQAIHENRVSVTKVRNILSQRGYIVLGEMKYFKEVSELQWQEITKDEWSAAWRDYYYPHRELINLRQPVKKAGDQEFNVHAHRAALHYMEMETGHRYTKIQERMLSFDFLRRLEVYCNPTK